MHKLFHDTIALKLPGERICSSNHRVVNPGKEAIGTRRWRLIHKSIFATNLPARGDGYVPFTFSQNLRSATAPTREDKFGVGSGSMAFS